MHSPCSVQVTLPPLPLLRRHSAVYAGCTTSRDLRKLMLGPP